MKRLAPERDLSMAVINWAWRHEAYPHDGRGLLMRLLWKLEWWHRRRRGRCA